MEEKKNYLEIYFIKLQCVTYYLLKISKIDNTFITATRILEHFQLFFTSTIQFIRMISSTPLLLHLFLTHV